MPAPSISELRKLSDTELINTHDRLGINTQLGIGYYIEELARRDQSRQTERMLGLTKWITVLTFVVTLATIVNLVIAYLVLSKM
jgi:hypothetical protein